MYQHIIMKMTRNLTICAIMALLAISCSTESPEINNDDTDITDDTGSDWYVNYSTLPIRSGDRPQTSNDVPHVQIGVDLVTEVHEEMVRRAYAIPGVEEVPSVIAGWTALSLSEDVTIMVPDAIIGDREFGHIHQDGSLHIYLEPKRAKQAVDAGWAVDHPYAVQGRSGWEGFVMLYTPQTMDELDTTFQLIVDGYNYVTHQRFSFSG